MSTTDETKAREYAETKSAEKNLYWGEQEAYQMGLEQGYLDGMKRGRAMGKANAVRQFQKSLRAECAKAWEAGMAAYQTDPNPYIEETS